MTGGVGEERVLGPNLGLWVGRGVKANLIQKYVWFWYDRWGVQGGGWWVLERGVRSYLTAHLYNTHSIPCTIHTSHLVQLILAGRRPELDF